MSRYDEIDKKTIINWNNIETDYEESQWKFVDGEILHFPDDSIERKRCKLVCDAYAILRCYEDEIKKNYALLDFRQMPFSGIDEFVFAAHRLCAVYHHDIRKIEDFFGKQEVDWSELKEYLCENFSSTAFNIIIQELVIPRNNAIDYARIAHIIRNSPAWNKKYKDMKFGEWYKKFCSIVGCEYKKNYKECKVSSQEKAYQDLKTKFGLLYSPNLTKSPKIPS